MKKIALSISTLLILTACGPNSNDAISYNDQIIDIIDKIKQHQENLIYQLDGHNIDSLKITQTAFENIATESTKKLSEIKAFDNATEYIDAAKKFVSVIQSLSTNEVKTLANLLAKDSLSITDEDVKLAEENGVNFDNKYEKASNEFAESQKQFSTKWNFKLTTENK
ncbi:MAG: hypothetical protein LCH32_13195 [Bacteroidetes bacterium]|nr:hypothetical protein [Bacteroidota bacterium]